MNSVRLLPILLVAASCLLALKTVGIVAGSGYSLRGLADAQAQDAAPTPAPRPLDGGSASARTANSSAPPRRSWAQEVLGYPEITGSIGDERKAEKPPVAQPQGGATPPPVDKAETKAPGAPATPSKAVDGTRVNLGEAAPLTPGERAVLERLQERRQELEARNRELDIRDGLLRAAEKRLEARLEELKRLEAQVKATVQQKDEAETARFKSLVTMYENMKPKEAARIFDRLDPRVLIEVAASINPRRMSDILAQMTPDAAERLTVELAARAAGNGARQPTAADLPKIVGRPRS